MTERKPYSKSQYWYSKLKDFDRCPRYFKLKHIDEVPIVEEKSADLAFGTAMHAAINHHLVLGDAGLPVFNHCWEVAKAEGLVYGRYKHHELQVIAKTLLERFERLHSKHFKPWLMEERLYSQEVPLEGTPDFVGEYKDTPSVVDFKTSGQRYHKLRATSDDQLPLYAWLAKNTKALDVKQVVYVVFIKDLTNPSIQVIESPLSAVGMKLAADNVFAKMRACEQKEHAQNRGACIMGQRLCPYFETCHGKQEKK